MVQLTSQSFHRLHENIGFALVGPISFPERIDFREVCILVEVELVVHPAMLVIRFARRAHPSMAVCLATQESTNYQSRFDTTSTE
jgi:hypothetical protein